MKKIYYIECDSEHYTPLTRKINGLFEQHFFGTRKSAFENMIGLKNCAKELFQTYINIERKKGNTITIDLWAFDVDNDFNLTNEDDLSVIWEHNKALIDSRYLCGRY